MTAADTLVPDDLWQGMLLEELSRQDRLDWSRASLDSISVRAKRGAA
jgi:hypothetical protein